MKRKCIQLCAAVFMSLFCTDLFAAWTVDKQPDGDLVLRNESGQCTGKIPTGLLPIGSSRGHVRKSFDLKQFPAGSLDKARSAYILIRAKLQDFGKDGLTESLNIFVNGRKRSFYMADLVPEKYNGSTIWMKMPFPKEWITGDKLTVVVRKETMDKNDYLYVVCDENVERTTTSSVSYDDGKSFADKWYNNKGKGEFAIRLGLSEKTEEVNSLHYHSWAPDTSGMILGKGVKVMPDGLLEFRGEDAVITFKDSEKFNISRKGMTIFMTFRLHENLNKDGASLFGKDKSFLAFASGRSSFVNLSANGNRYAESVIAKAVKPGQWYNIALSIEFIHEPEQGNIGYRTSLYLNGVLNGQKMFYHFSPDQLNFPLLLGAGYPGAGFSGEIDSFDFYPEYLNEAEMMVRIRSNERLRQDYKDNRPGFKPVSSGFEKKISEKLKSAATTEAKWLVSALGNSARQGADEKMVTAILDKLNFINAKELDAEKLAAEFNRVQQDYSIAVTPDILLLSAGQGERNPAIAAVFNRRNQSELFHGRPLDWRIDFGKDQIFPYSANVKFKKVFDESVNGTTMLKYRWEHPDFELYMTAVLKDNRIEVDFGGKSFKRNITGYLFPQFQLARLPGKNDSVLFPFFSGNVIKSPTQGVQFDGTYPSARVTMPFAAYYDESGNGIYTAVEDSNASTRQVTCIGRGGMVSHEFTQSVAYTPGKAGNSFTLNGTAVIELYKGKWFEAGQVYRKFLEKNAPWYVRELPRKSTPEWFRNLPLWFHNIAGTKEGYLYFYDYLGTPFGINGTAKCKEYNERGLRTKPYTNARLWKYTPNHAKQVDHTRDADALASAIIQIDGKAYTEKYGKPFIVPCPSDEVWQQMLYEQTVSCGKNYDTVYHDQLACAAPKVCYNTGHKHLPGSPDNWLYDGYLKLFKRLKADYPEFTHDSEDASEPYAATLDAFMPWRFLGPNHVPLFQSLYGGGRIQFNGRASDVHGVSGSYESFFPRIAEQFVYGEQLGWFNYNEFAYASPRRPFVKKLTKLRYALVDYLNAANMLAPMNFKKAIPRLRTQWSAAGITRLVDTDKVLHCAWERIDGAIVVLFVNSVNETITVEPEKQPWMKQGVLFICKEGVGGSLLYTGNNPPAVTLKPYSVEIWFYGGQKIVEDAEKIALLMKDFPNFDEGRTIYNQQKSNPGEVAAVKGKWIPAKSCTAYDRGFMSPIQAFGNSTRSQIEEFRWNWICCDSDSAVRYDAVDCGNGVEELQFRLAVTAKDAGKFQVYGKNNELLGTGEVSGTGEWFDFKVFPVKLNKKLTGKQSLVFKFERPVRFSGWQAVK